MAARSTSLAGKVCLVTGASRGIGKGIALQLGQAGATVYITGRTLKKGPSDMGSLVDTAAEIEERGGRCVPVVCDHSKDEDIQNLFDRIKTEQSGQLDILVNNAYSGVTAIMKYTGVGFWEQPFSLWDDINCVGLRNHYLCTVLASRLMVPRKKGLIVNISSGGGLRYLFNIPYGVGKAACDRMAADCAFELRKHNVAVVSLWPGVARTEIIVSSVEQASTKPQPESKFAGTFSKRIASGESVEFAGKSIVNLALDRNLMSKSGRILITADLASEYGFVDIDGKSPDNIRSLSFLISQKYPWLASIVPRWVKVPCWVMHLASNKF